MPMTAIEGGRDDPHSDASGCCFPNKVHSNNQLLCTNESLKMGTFLARKRKHEHSFTCVNPAAIMAEYHTLSCCIVFLEINRTIVMKDLQCKYLKGDILGTS